MEDFEEALRLFQSQVATPNPALDQAFASTREAFADIGVPELTPTEAKAVLSVLVLFLQAPEESRALIAAYLGSLLPPSTP